MKIEGKELTGGAASRRLSGAERRRQLLDTALLIVREQGADRLTLGHLAARAGVSKPVAYDHFGTRSGLLIALYRMLDMEKVDAFRAAMETGDRNAGQTIEALADAYIRCASDATGEVHAIGAALAGSREKAAVLQELLDHAVQMFVSVLQPHSVIAPRKLKQLCVGLVGAGEALAAAVTRGDLDRDDAVEAFTPLIGAACEGS